MNNPNHFRYMLRDSATPESNEQGYKPYTIPYSGTGQAVSNQQPMAAAGFRVMENYHNMRQFPMYRMPAPMTPPGSFTPAGLVTPRGPAAPPSPPVTKNATPIFTELKAPQPEKHEAPFIFTINKLDIMVDRYRCQGLTKEQVLEQTNLYPEAKELTDMDLQTHAAKLYGRARNTYCAFRQWSSDAKFIDDYYKTVANNYLIATDIPKADPNGNKPSDVSRRADRLNAILKAMFSEAELLTWMTERTRLPTMMDAATGEAAAKFFNGGSDSDDAEVEEKKDLKNLAEFIDHPDGSTTFNPEYLEKVNGQDASALRALIKESLLIPDNKKNESVDKDDESDELPACPPSTPAEVSEEDAEEYDDLEFVEYTEEDYDDEYELL